MKRWNAQKKQWERKQGETWVAANATESAATELDTALGQAFAELDLPPTDAQVEPVTASAPETVPSAVATALPEAVPVVVSDGHAAGDAGGPNGTRPGAEPGSDVGDLDFDIGGLVSGDSSRSTAGSRTVRERLTKLAQRGKRTAGAGKKIEVGPRAAVAVGPAVKEGTASRQQKKKAPETSGTVGQRYVNRPAPELLSGRPKWVQELFEAHFRSEHTLAMRRTYNRMKISRQDYCIGWLTLLDKIREEPSIARLKDGKDGQGA